MLFTHLKRCMLYIGSVVPDSMMRVICSRENTGRSITAACGLSAIFSNEERRVFRRLFFRVIPPSFESESSGALWRINGLSASC